MNHTRRNFLKFMGVAAAGLCAASAGSALAGSSARAACSTTSDGAKRITSGPAFSTITPSCAAA